MDGPQRYNTHARGGRAAVIGIGGASCAGKTLLAEAVAARLNDALVLPVDAYYRDLSRLTEGERAGVNFDEPAAIDHQLLASHLGHLRDMRAVDRPVYDFATHTRCSQTRRVGPAAYVIVEGLLALYWRELRVMMDAAVFVDAPETECLARRTARDVRDRGRTPESIRNQFDETVVPMFQKWCAQTRCHADIVLDGLEPVGALADSVIELLREKALLRTI